MSLFPIKIKDYLTNQFLMRFKSEETEIEFRDYFYSSRRILTQVSVFIAALLFLSVEPIARVELPKDGQYIDHYARWYLQFPCTFVCFLITLVSTSIRFIQATILIVIFIASLSTSALTWMLGENSVDFYNFAILQIVLFSFLLSSLPFRKIFFTIFITTTIQVVVVFSVVEPQSLQVEAIQGALAFVFGLAFAAYSVERSSRIAFISMIALNREYEERLLLQSKKSTWLKIITDFLRHELKNSLIGVTSSLELIMRRNHNSELEQYILRAKHSTAFMKRLLEEASASTSIESALDNMILERLNISDLIDYKIDEYRDLYPNNKFDISVEPNIYANCDMERIEQVLDKVINNAVEHCLSCHPICISLYKNHESIFIKISDIGESLKEDVDIFQPFLSSKSSDADHHHGFGLYVVKRIIEAHGGNVSANSFKNPDGAEFTLSLPLPA